MPAADQATYFMRVDIAKDGFVTNYNIGDISNRLIGQATWNVGMDSADQTFATPARLTVTVDNFDGAWNPDTLGAELLTNGAFTAWTLDDPDSWTVTGESGTDPEVSQVGGNELHGGVGTGACNFFSTGAPITISQLAFPIRTSYRVVLDVSLSAESTGYLAAYYGAVRISPYYHMSGTYTFYFNTDNVASGAFKLTATGVVDMTVNSVSIKQTSLYGKLVEEGILCNLSIVTGGFSYPQFIGRLDSINLTPGTIGRRIATLTFVDPMYDLLDTEYIPVLYTDITADVAIQAVLDAPIVPFPYAYNFWMLGIQGSSELDLTTKLYSPPTYTLDTGISTYAWVGDNSIDNKEGVSAQSFLRDLVEGEIYGRFFYDPYLTGFIFHNRQRDALNKTVEYTLTDDDYEVDLSSFTKIGIINQSTVSYQPRSSGTPGTVLWSHGILDMGKGDNKFTIRYRDLTNPDARIGAFDVIPPQPVTDYICQNIDTGEDLTSTVTVLVKPGANSAEVVLTNPNFANIRFTLLQVRGTPLTTFDPSSVTSVNGDSARAYKTAPDRRSYQLIDNKIDAKATADFIVYKNADPIPVFDKIGYYKDKSNARLMRSLLNPVGSRITITDTFLNHSADYFIVGYRHQVTFGADSTHTVIYTLKPAAKENFWILDTSTLGTGTRLGL